MSAVLAHPAWQPAQAPGARPARRRTGVRPARRGNLQLVGPGFVPQVGAPAAADGRSRAAEARSEASGRLRLTARGRGVVTALALVLATAVSVGVGALVGVAVNPAVGGETTTVTVGAGETLWSLASAVAEPGEDPRELVEHITTLNGLASSELAVGQELVVPAG
ncbi:LysM domain-containing protein [Georgenia soli]|uniref:LysM domain-containing protein n=1 Tax=Georgenia soli TaxID=638953 RepID=A0A2A9EJK4_9MICO|nr:LysM peptidoglycan-binding domain-containing protein [Georgenia soli]PFG38425.1 LysM domain-containing protein [Georgenia soli]